MSHFPTLEHYTLCPPLASISGAGTKRHRKSMLLSELCVVTVTVPAEVAQSQKGRGAVLKFRFSPYTQIEFLRVAILKVELLQGWVW